MSISRITEQSFQSFVETLSDEKKYEGLKAAAQESYSKEMPLYWEHFQNFKKQCYLSLLKHLISKGDAAAKIPVFGLRKPGVAPISDIQALKTELEKPMSKIFVSQLASKIPSTLAAAESERVIIPLKRMSAVYYIKIYETFVASGSQYELNLNEKVRKQCQKVVDALHVRIDQLAKQVGTLRVSGEAILPNTYLVFHDNLELMSFDGDNLFISINLYDEIKEHILSLLYDNTFSLMVRSLSKQSGLNLLSK
jgi:hypothetical protein